MKQSIKTRLLAAFFLVSTALLVSSAVLILMQRYIIGEYTRVVATMSTQHQLSQSLSELIDTYNELVLSNSTILAANNQKVKTLTTHINQNIQLLDAAVVDVQSRRSFLGLKNSIDAVLNEVNAGLNDVAQDKPTAFTHYQAAHRNYDFVQSNITSFTFDQLKYINSIEGKLHSTYTALEFCGIALVLLVAIASALYGLGVARKIVQPLRKLTDIATGIAAGHMNTAFDPLLLTRTDEIGSLAGSFNTMLQRLKEKITELNNAKATVEQKVTDRTRELSETKAELTASIASLPFGFAIINLQNQIVFSNSALMKLVGRHIPDDLESSGKVLKEIADTYKSSIDLFDCIKQVRAKKFGIERNIEFGPQYYRVLVTAIQNDSGVIGTVLTMEDTTDERAAQRSRDEFFSIASHELRTPLTAVRGNAQLMLQFYADQFKDPNLHEMVDDIHDASIRLIDIVNDFLDVSRLEQGKIVFKNAAFDPIDLCESILRVYDTTSSRHNIALTFQKPKQPIPKIFADSDRTRQIIINLISNGIKYTEKGSVTLSLMPNGNKVSLAVTDTGKGIPVGSQHLLFRKFQQASNNLLTRDNTRSTGLGLYISRLMAEGMNGKLELTKSEIGKGSTFTLELPADKTAGIAAPEAKTNKAEKA